MNIGLDEPVTCQVEASYYRHFVLVCHETQLIHAKSVLKNLKVCQHELNLLKLGSEDWRHPPPEPPCPHMHVHVIWLICDQTFSSMCMHVHVLIHTALPAWSAVAVSS